MATGSKAIQISRPVRSFSHGKENVGAFPMNRRYTSPAGTTLREILPQPDIFPSWSGPQALETEECHNGRALMSSLIFRNMNLERDNPEIFHAFAEKMSQTWSSSAENRLEKKETPVAVHTDAGPRTWNMPGELASSPTRMWIYVDGKAIPDEPADKAERIASALQNLLERAGIPATEDVQCRIFSLAGIGSLINFESSLHTAGGIPFEIHGALVERKMAIDFSISGQGRLKVTVNTEGPVTILNQTPIPTESRDTSRQSVEFSAIFSPQETASPDSKMPSLEIVSASYQLQVPDTPIFRAALSPQEKLHLIWEKQKWLITEDQSIQDGFKQLGFNLRDHAERGVQLNNDIKRQLADSSRESQILLSTRTTQLDDQYNDLLMVRRNLTHREAALKEAMEKKPELDRAEIRLAEEIRNTGKTIWYS